MSDILGFRASDARMPWVDPSIVYTDLPSALPDPLPDRPMVGINMVSTLDGKAVVGGRVAGIGSRFDRGLMDRLRTGFEMVLSGAGTLRADGFDPAVVPEMSDARVRAGLTPQPLAAIVTGSGAIPLDGRFWRQTNLDRVVFTSERAVLEHADDFEVVASRARVVVLGADRVDLREALRFARQEMGVRRVLCEGGPTINQELFSLDLVDELYLTLAPKIVGGRSLTIVDHDGEPVLDFRRLELLSCSLLDSEFYLRYRVRR